MLVSLIAALTVVPTALAVLTTPAVALAPPAGGTLTAKVFATREGLVGWKTANGHKITKRDWFAALPSWRGLSDRGEGDKSVRAHEGNDRCVFLPVWDVGPWNTKDDYWADDRHMWEELPRGKPQAQAAYQDDHHDGEDEFGREVLNPAGHRHRRRRVLGRPRPRRQRLGPRHLPVDRRGRPGCGGRRRRRVAAGALGPEGQGRPARRRGEYAQLPIRCQVKGDKVKGTVRTTTCGTGSATASTSPTRTSGLIDGAKPRKC